MMMNMKMMHFIVALCAFCFLAGLLPSRAQQPPERQVAITIDDLPAGAANSMSAAEITAMTSKLLSTLRDQKVPVIGFVNEKKLYRFGEVDERVKALRMWLDYGFELGNHTFSHMSLNQAGLQAWEDDVVQGESVTRLLLGEHKMPLRYFRHPFLDTGRDLQTRRQAEAFLTARGLILRQVGAYKLPHALRMSVGTEEANRLVVAALKEFLAKAA